MLFRSGLQPVLGAELKVGDEERSIKILAKNQEGVRELYRLSAGISYDSEFSDNLLVLPYTADATRVRDNLFVQEVNIQVELKRHWAEIAGYLTMVLRTSGLGDVEAEEMAILPGMEELSAMMYVNQYRARGTFDVVVLDCAPTAESLRFVSMPTTLDWYMKHVFPVERRVLNVVRPLANRISPVELPSDSYFANLKTLFEKLDGVDTILQDPATTSVRLVSNAERVVVRETQRAYVYFMLHGLSVDTILVNRMLPDDAAGSFLGPLRESQQQIFGEMTSYFDPVPVRREIGRAHV